MTSAKIGIKVQLWSGWAPDQPEPKDYEFIVKDGETLAMFSVDLPYRFGVRFKDDSSVVLTVGNQNLTLPNPDGTVNLKSSVSEVIITKAVSAKLVSASMDAGARLEISLLEVN